MFGLQVVELQFLYRVRNGSRIDLGQSFKDFL